MNAERKQLTIFTPMEFDLGEDYAEQAVKDMVERHEKYGLDFFILACPSKGWRAVGLPETEVYEALARQFRKVRDAAAPYGITCGWWMYITVKAGASAKYPPMVREDGSETPFSLCPLDPGFRENFASNAARFAAIAAPALIFLEDDYSIRASTCCDGCFCGHHLDEFAKRVGRRYTREELVGLFGSGTPEAGKLKEKWRELMRDTMVWLSEALRKAIDTVDPDIPIALCEPGAATRECDMTEAVSRALAGPRHRPMCRVCGTGYNGFQSDHIPSILYHPLWIRQRTPEPFCFIHESDTYPHTRFYSSALQMRALIGAVYSFGYEGSIFQMEQFWDDKNEENGYAEMLARERTRFAAASAAARKCRVTGVSLPADACRDNGRASAAVQILTHWGIPFTTQPSDVAFWDGSRAEEKTDAEVREQLSKGLLLDGSAAKVLAERGYGRYLGVSVGEDMNFGTRAFDMSVYDRIRDGFAPDSIGRKMPGANTFSKKGNGAMLRMTLTDPGCEVITETFEFGDRFVTPSMTRFVNELGGRVAVLGTTLAKNESQTLYNYRRQKLMAEIIGWLGGDYVMVRNDPKIYPIMNVPVDAGTGFIGMLTLENLSEDACESVTLRLPAAWRQASEVFEPDADGNWQPVAFRRTADGMEILHGLPYLAPLYLMFR